MANSFHFIKNPGSHKEIGGKSVSSIRVMNIITGKKLFQSFSDYEPKTRSNHFSSDYLILSIFPQVMESFHICFFGLTCNEKQIICFPYIIRKNQYQKDNLVTN